MESACNKVNVKIDLCRIDDNDFDAGVRTSNDLKIIDICAFLARAGQELCDFRQGREAHSCTYPNL